MTRAPILSLSAAVALTAALALPAAGQAQSPADFYKGKTVQIYIGFSPGGSYDLFARLLSRHIGKHIPGNPTVVATNMPGAGSFNAANFLFGAAPKDGTAMGIVSQTLAIEEALKTKGVQYKAAEFNWIGRATANIEVQVIWNTSKAKTMDDAKSNVIPVASTGPGSPSEGYPKMLNGTYGTQFKIIRGYPGSTDGLLAMERGEVDGALTSWSTMKGSRKGWLDEKKAHMLVQYVLQRAAELPDVPAVTEFAKNQADKDLVTFYASAAEVGRSFLAPPGIPEDRVKALQTAFDATMKDAEFVAEVMKARLDFVPMPAAGLRKLIVDTASVSPAIVQRLQNILKD